MSADPKAGKTPDTTPIRTKLEGEADAGPKRSQKQSGQDLGKDQQGGARHDQMNENRPSERD